MSLRRTGDVIELYGVCGVEDAEPLLDLLREPGRYLIDVTGVDHLHAAVLQLLRLFGAAIRGTPRDEFSGICLGLPMAKTHEP